MEINTTGLASREFLPSRNNVEQELTQRAQEKDDSIQQSQKALEPRPVEQASADKLGRIDIYA
jgi:hypothetical protein